MAEKKENKSTSYADKRGFNSINVSELKDVIKLAIRADLIPALVGAAGIGKTAIVTQAASEIEVEWTPPNSNKPRKDPLRVIPFFTSQKAPEDVGGIPVPDMDDRTVTFLKPKELPKPSDPPTLLFLDELNQGDHTVIRTLFQLLGERRIGEYVFAPHHRLIAAMNPDGENYQTIKPTPALSRRLTWIQVNFSPLPFISYMENSGKFHPAVISYLKHNPPHCLNEEALNNDKVFANPASWEKVSNICNSLSPTDSIATALPLICGLVGKEYGHSFYKHLQAFGQNINPKDILEDYAKVRKSILKSKSTGRADLLSQIVSAVVVECPTIDATNPANEYKVKNFGLFMADLPADVGMQCGRQLLDSFSEVGKSEDSVPWMKILYTIPECREFYNKALALQSTGADEDEDDEDI